MERNTTEIIIIISQEIERLTTLIINYLKVYKKIRLLCCDAEAMVFNQEVKRMKKDVKALEKLRDRYLRL